MNVLFGGISSPETQEAHKIEGTITQTNVEETVEALANADSVILVRVINSIFLLSTDLSQVVGYGMAVAKAQYAISEITAMLRKKGINVRVSVEQMTATFDMIQMQYTVCYPSCRWPHAGTVQCSAG